MKQSQVAWSILIIVVLLLVATPITYMRVTGNHIIVMQSIKDWTRLSASYDITSRHANGSQDWIKRRGPIVILSRNIHVPPSGNLWLTGGAITVRTGTGQRFTSSALYMSFRHQHLAARRQPLRFSTVQSVGRPHSAQRQ